MPEEGERREPLASPQIRSTGAPAMGTEAPRGSAPAEAERRARGLFQAKKYRNAARAWKEWARTVPPGSWTVQIAAIRLDRSQSTRSLASAADRPDLFVLPAGSLPHGLAPVCVGIYAAEEDARRAAASVAPFPGSSSRPLAKPIASLSPAPPSTGSDSSAH